MNQGIFWRFRSFQVGVLVMASLLTGCAMDAHSLQEASAKMCDSGSFMTETTLYFGLSRPHGADITQAEWQKFVDHEVTPRFRDGLTVFKAQGQWLGQDGKVAKEGSRALMLIHDVHDAKSNQQIEALRTIYKQSFDQESVMRVDAMKCVAF